MSGFEAHGAGEEVRDLGEDLFLVPTDAVGEFSGGEVLVVGELDVVVEEGGEAGGVGVGGVTDEGCGLGDDAFAIGFDGRGEDEDADGEGEADGGEEDCLLDLRLHVEDVEEDDGEEDEDAREGEGGFEEVVGDEGRGGEGGLCEQGHG